MSNRMDKYYDNPEALETRSKRNKDLYQGMNKSSLNDYNVNSNVSVLDVSGNEIDVNKIKDILDEKYKNPIRRKSIDIEEDIAEEEPSFETKDYDLTKILEKARSEKNIDYAEERLKKLRDTQYDILNQLNLEKPEEEIEEKDNTLEQELITMIETITHKEREKVEDSQELELLTDLKGNDNTIVVPPITEEQKEEYDKQKKEDTGIMENSFYTGNLKVSAEDYEDFQELKNEINSNSTTIKILVVLFAIILIIGLLFFFDKVLSWGIF